MSRAILHLDLDQFIAAVEILRRPELAGRPLVVGGDGDPTKRGVVSTASYEARAFGVHSGMPLRTARRRCPDAVFLPVDVKAYLEASRRVDAVLRSLPAVVENAGWDEWYLSVDDPDPEALARRIRDRVLAATGLSCSIGVGENRLQAKIGSGLDKPGGIVVLTSATWRATVGHLPPSILHGVGAKTARRLRALGITTVDELAAGDVERLTGAFGPRTGPWLVGLARGRASAEVSSAPWVPRSRSRETTFQRDLEDPVAIRRELGGLAARLAGDVERDGRPVVRVVVKVRFRPFSTHTHGVAMSPPSTEREPLVASALAALEDFDLDRPVRLLGVRVEFAR